MNRRITVIVVVFALIGFAFLWFMFLLGIPTWTALKKAEMPFSEFIQWRSPEFRETFVGSVWAAVSPLSTLRGVPGKALVMAASALFACWINLRQRTISLATFERGLISLVPFYAAVLLFPLEVKTVFRVLAEVGLSSQTAIGAGLGEATTVLFFGAWCSLICFTTTFLVHFKNLGRDRG